MSSEASKLHLLLEQRNLRLTKFKTLIDLDNIHDSLNILSHLTCEFFIQNHPILSKFLLDDSFSLDPEPIPVLNEYNQIIDYSIIDIDYKGIRWEFKMVFKKDKIPLVIHQLENYYKYTVPKVNIKVFHLSKNLIKELKLSKLEEKIFNILYEAVKNFEFFGLEIPKHFIEKGRDRPSIDKLIDNSKFFQDVKNTLPNFTVDPNFDDIIKCYQLSFPLIRNLLIKNLVKPENLSEYINFNFDFNIIQSINDKNSIWNRDKNQKFGKGYKAIYLGIVPNIERFELTQIDVEKILSINLNIKFENILKKMLVLNTYYLGDYNTLKELVRLLAFFQTTKHIDKSSIKINYMKDEIKKFNLNLQKQILSKFNMKIGFSGVGVNMRLDRKEREYMGIDIRKEKEKNKDYYETPKEFRRSFIKPDDIWFNTFKLFDEYKETKGDPRLKIADCYDAYSFNKVLNDISNTIVNESTNIVRSIFESDVGKTLNRERLLLRSLAIGSYGGSYFIQNYVNMCIVKTPLPFFYCYSSGNPNQSTSGAILRVIKVLKHHKFNSLMYGEFYKVDLDDTYELIIFKPIRVNWQSCLQADANFASWCGVMNFFLSYNVNLLKNDLFNSMFLRFTEQHFTFMDIIYAFYKLIQAMVTFGETDFKDVLDNLPFDDIRFTTILYNLKSNFREFIVKYKVYEDYEINSIREGKRKSLFDVGDLIDPIFGFKHTCYQSVLGIAYIKQAFMKDRGVDEKKVYTNFVLKALDYAQEYISNPFSINQDCKWWNNMAPEFFSDNLIENNKFRPIMYFPQAIAYAYKMLTDQIKNNDKLDIVKSRIEKELNTEVNKLTTSSKCLITEELVKYKENKEKDEKQKYAYPGLRSINYYLAVDIEERKIKSMFNDKDIPEFFNNNIKYDIRDKHLTVLEMLIGALRYSPNYNISNTVIKMQRDKNLRLFQVQITTGIYAIKVLDRSYKPILENSEFDLILVPGNLKYIKFQEIAKKINSYFGCYTFSADISKFGDKYPPEANLILAELNYKYGIKTKNQVLLEHGIMKLLMDRKQLLPPFMQKIIKFYGKNVELKYKNSRDGKTENIFLKYQNLINLTEKINIDKKTLYDKCMLSNVYFEPKCGWVLGSLNDEGTTLSVSAHNLTKDIMTWIGCKNIFGAFAHSDDHLSVTNLRINDDFTLCLKRLNEWFNPKNRFFIKRVGNLWEFENKENKSSFKKDDDIFIIYVITLIFSLKCMGQNPSLKKIYPAYTGEMIQVLMNNETVTVPIIRYAVTLLAELPHISPDNDIMSMIGRVYDLVVNGASQVMIGAQMILANSLIWETWGGLDNCSVNNTLEMQGFYWSIPSLFVTHGFNANFIRLLSNKEIERKIICNFSTKEVWKPLNFKLKETVNIQDLKENDLKEINQLIDSTEEELNSQSEEILDEENNTNDLSILRSIKVSYSNKIIVQKTFNQLFELSKDDIFNFADKYEINIPNERPDKVIRNIRKNWIIYSGSGFTSSTITTMSHLSSLLSQVYSDTIIKKFESVKIVNMLGYRKRIFINPFSDKINKLLKTEFKTLTTEEIWKTFNLICLSDLKVELGYKFLQFFRNLYSSEIRFLLTFDIDEDLAFYERNINFDGKYRLIELKGYIKPEEIYLRKLLIAVLETLINKGLPLDSTFVVRTNNNLLNNEIFKENVNLIQKSFY